MELSQGVGGLTTEELEGSYGNWKTFYVSRMAVATVYRTVKKPLSYTLKYICWGRF